MEQTVETYLHTETAEPARKIIRSDGVLYVLLLIGVVGIVLLGNVCLTRWNWPRAYTQVGLYLLLAALGYWVYRERLVSFRYLLTDRMLTVDRVTGRKVKPEAHVHLADIEKIRPYAELGEKEGGKRCALYHGKRRETLAVVCCEGGVRRTLLLSPSRELRGKLTAQWKNVRR